MGTNNWAPKTVKYAGATENDAFGSRRDERLSGAFDLTYDMERVHGMMPIDTMKSNDDIKRENALYSCLSKLHTAVKNNEIGFEPKEAISLLQKCEMEARDGVRPSYVPFRPNGAYCPPEGEMWGDKYCLNVNDLLVMSRTVPFAEDSMILMLEHPEQYMKFTELGGVDDVTNPVLYQTYGKSLLTKSFASMDGPERMNFYSHCVNICEQIGQHQERQFGRNPYKEAQEFVMESESSEYDVTTHDGMVQYLMANDEVIQAYQKEVDALNAYTGLSVEDAAKMSDEKVSDMALVYQESMEDVRAKRVAMAEGISSDIKIKPDVTKKGPDFE